MNRAALVVLALVASTAHAEPPAKKDRERATKSTHHAAPPLPGTTPIALVNVFNEHTLEWLAVDPAALPTQSAEPGLPRRGSVFEGERGLVDHFLRDHYTNQAMHMDSHLIPIVVAAAQHFHSDVVDVVSAFRHPKFNLILRKKGHQVARDSQHTHGNAIDFFVPKVTTQQLHAWAKAQKLGGVGIYLQSGFVHMDTGAIRYWSGD